MFFWISKPKVCKQDLKTSEKVSSSDILSPVVLLAMQEGPQRRCQAKEVPVLQICLPWKTSAHRTPFPSHSEEAINVNFYFFSLNVKHYITFVTFRSFIWHSWARSIDIPWRKITFSTYIFYLLSEVIILSPYSTNKSTPCPKTDTFLTQAI